MGLPAMPNQDGKPVRLVKLKGGQVVGMEQFMLDRSLPSETMIKLVRLRKGHSISIRGAEIIYIGEGNDDKMDSRFAAD